MSKLRSFLVVSIAIVASCWSFSTSRAQPGVDPPVFDPFCHPLSDEQVRSRWPTLDRNSVPLTVSDECLQAFNNVIMPQAYAYYSAMANGCKIYPIAGHPEIYFYNCQCLADLLAEMDQAYNEELAWLLLNCQPI